MDEPLFEHVLREQHRAEAPLARRVAPKSLDDIIGQDHILGPGQPLRRAIESDRFTSLILYGPPGTGKTTTTRAILQAHVGCQRNVVLASPTGRAAKRLSEVTGYPAMTIHRLLEVDPTTFQFKRNHENPIECDTLIVAVGVRPRMQLAVDAGIKTNRGIVVDQSMATSAPDVYACGDVAEAYDSVYAGYRVVPIWPGAYRGGYVAGLNMAGQHARFDDQTTMNTIKYFGLSLVSAGEINPAPSAGCEVLAAVDLDRGWYRKMVLRDDALIGFVVAGAIERSGVLNWLIRERIPTTPFKQRLLKDDFDLIHIPADLRRAHYLEATANPAQTAIAWGTPVAGARSASANGGRNGAH